MEHESRRRLEDLFGKVIELPAEERRSFLDRSTGDDSLLRREIESLLGAELEAEGFLEEPMLPGPIVRPTLGEDAGGSDGFIGPYRVLRRLGEGGMSHVYLAVRDDDEFQKLVALKIIRQGLDSTELRRRFRTERQILASLDHPNIAKLLDGGSTESGFPFFIMEFIQGLPLDLYCDRHQLRLEERLKLFRSVCSAVLFAHQNLVVHRDIKMNNILVTAEGVPKLLDFGIAKLLKPESFPLPVELTATSLRPMSPYYASPEQISGGAVTTASDVYSLGVLLYKLLCGHLPYRLHRWTVAEVERAVLDQEPERPSVAVGRVETPRITGRRAAKITPRVVARARGTSPFQLRRELARDLDNVALVALRKEPRHRYGSVDLLSEDVRRYLEGLPVEAHKASLVYRASKFLRRNRIAVAVGSAFLALLLGFTITMTLQAHRVAVQRDRAELERDRAEQVVFFLQEIFRVSDPIEGEGEVVTAREILDRGARRVARELGDQPEVQATLMEAIGRVYGNLGLYSWGEPLLRQALDKRREVLGADHPDVARSLSSLGYLLQEKGDYQGAEPLLRHALELRRSIFGEEHPQVAESLQVLGTLYRNAGKFEEAEALYRQAIKIDRASLGHLEPSLADHLSNLAMLLADLARYEEAAPLFREALDARRMALGEEHPRVVDSINNLGVFLGMQGQLEEAEALFRQALTLRRRTFGDFHPLVAESLNNLGRLKREQGDYLAAEGLYREAAAVQAQVAGESHPNVAMYQNNLAVMLLETGELEKAEPLFRNALEIRRQKLGNRHAHTGISLRSLGTLLVRKGDPGAGEPYLREALEVFRSSLPERHWRTGEAKAYLGECLAAQQRSVEGELLMLEGHTILEETRGPTHRRTRDLARLLAAHYSSLGREEEASRFRNSSAS